MGTLTVQTLQAPTSGANANKVIIPSGQTLDASNGLTPPAGHVVQAVQHLHAATSTGNLGRVDLSTSGFTDIFSQNITTKLANSVIHVSTTCIGYSSAGNLRAQARILYSVNGGTNFYEIYRDPYAFYSNYPIMVPHSATQLHSPSAAAGTTIIYKLQVSRDGSVAHYFKYADGGGTTHNHLTLMEIAA